MVKLPNTNIYQRKHLSYSQNNEYSNIECSGLGFKNATAVEVVTAGKSHQDLE